MAYKGKAVLDAEAMKREWEEEQEKKRVHETMDRWWASQQGLSFRPPIPEENIRLHPSLPSDQVRHYPSHPPGFPIRIGSPPAGSSNQRPPTPYSPTYTPKVSVATDWIAEEDLVEFWRRKAAPVPPNPGPWFRFEGGYIQFRHGTTWVDIHRAETKAARDREEARLRGEPIEEVSPPKQPGEHILRVVAHEIPDPENEEEENDDEDPMEGSEGDDNSEEGEQDPQPWSDTSTITEERSQVPLKYRRQGLGRSFRHFLRLRRR